MRWNKRGLIFTPNGEFGWMNSHAQVPTALLLEDRIRVYFATRPHRQLSLPAYVDLDRNDLKRVLGISEQPLLNVGAPGTFDADGVMPSAVTRKDSRILLYYSGWSALSGKAPYNNATGLAVSDDGGSSFHRMFQGPILDRTALEPWSATSPAVIESQSEWLMWYSSGTGWIDVDGKLEHVYVLKSARSKNGIDWHRDARPAIPTVLENESQTRPTILFLQDTWHMWFCYRGAVQFRERGQTYKMGYAWSKDLKSWHRDDAAASIDPSAEGWDSQMIAYPNILWDGSKAIMFYNGNGFGESGFGYAVLDEAGSA